MLYNMPADYILWHPPTICTSLWGSGLSYDILDVARQGVARFWVYMTKEMMIEMDQPTSDK
jgi:hypothetical protein